MLAAPSLVAGWPAVHRQQAAHACSQAVANIRHSLQVTSRLQPYGPPKQSHAAADLLAAPWLPCAEAVKTLVGLQSVRDKKAITPATPDKTEQPAASQQVRYLDRQTARPHLPVASPVEIGPAA